MFKNSRPFSPAPLAGLQSTSAAMPAASSASTPEWIGENTPKPVLDKVNAALKTALKDAQFIKNQEALGADIVDDGRVNPAEHKKFVEAEIAKWGPVIKAAGQYAD